ncbi:MAG: 2-hydroxychromene-2-carboxylate isomerase [Maricaulaceae bacterium]|jgi:2-hydroxychromene-2-carboxylate isomerase
MSKVEFFFDLSSPWTRLAFHNIQPIVEAAGAEIVWRPFLVGGVFNAVNQSVYASRDDPDNPRTRQSPTWLQEWARLAGVPMAFPSEHHPLRAVLPMRVCCCLEDDQPVLFNFASAAFHAYFAEQKNLDDPAVLTGVADACGLDGAKLVQQAGEQATKDRLRSNTDEAIERGAFGSPTIFVDTTRLYFGNDQLPLVRQALSESSPE